MTEEIKNEVSEKTKDCKCCQRCEKITEGIKEFAFKAGIVYVGVTLAILTSVSLLKPKHHTPMHRPIPRMERQLPPPPMAYNDFGARRAHPTNYMLKGQNLQSHNKLKRDFKNFKERKSIVNKH